MPDAATDIDRHGAALDQRLLECIDPIRGGFGPSSPKTLVGAVDVAAHQRLWRRYMVSGEPGFGDAVLRSLRAICRSAIVDHDVGGIYRLDADDAARGQNLEKELADNARFLELLTWVWRVERCAALRQCAEQLVGWVVAELRVTGFGFAARAGAERRSQGVRADCNGLMLVALVEAGSVFERRDWLALAREVFDEVVAALADAGALWHSLGDRAQSAGVRLDDHAMMSRAAIRLFEAFGKQRYLDLAESWIAMADAVADGMAARAPSLGDAPMIGVLARLHALTGATGYAERAAGLVEALQPAIVRSGIAGAAALADVQTAARPLSIAVSGDPRLAETRDLMRIALDCGVPDRLVLGPGAGGTPGERPLARISVGAYRLAPIDEAAQLRAMLAPGGLAAAFLHSSRAKLLTVEGRTA